MKNKLTILLLVLFFNACYSEKPEQAEQPLAPEPLKDFNHKNVPSPLLAISDSASIEEMEEDLKGNLFGKFFSDKASFYIIDTPQNKIYDTKIHSITLYYLNGALYKTKYLLEKDVTNKLINLYGKFKIKGFDLENRSLLQQEAIVAKKGNKWELNRKFNNYELTWTLGDKQLKMKVNKNDSIAPYKFIERSPHYEKIFRDIEHEAEAL